MVIGKYREISLPENEGAVKMEGFGFVEQVVKRDKTAKNMAIKILAVTLLIVIPLIFVFLGRFVPYLVMVGFFLFIGGIYVVWWIFTSQRVEYEYSINGDSLDVHRIVSLRKRKKICSIPIKDIESMKLGDSEVRDRNFRKVYVAAKNMNDTENNRYAVFVEPTYGKCLLVFNPNDDILNAMKPYMQRELVVELFYKNKK